MVFEHFIRKYVVIINKPNKLIKIKIIEHYYIHIYLIINPSLEFMLYNIIFIQILLICKEMVKGRVLLKKHDYKTRDLKGYFTNYLVLKL